jgi:hypothetical protein
MRSNGWVGVLAACALLAACRTPTTEVPKKAASARPEVGTAAVATPSPAATTAGGELR